MIDKRELTKVIHKALLAHSDELHLTLDEKWNIRVLGPTGDFYVSVDSFNKETWTVTEA